MSCKDDDDYMSDSFLLSVVDSSGGSRCKKRPNEQQHKQQNPVGKKARARQLLELMEKTRAVGSASAVSADSVGGRLLRKLGYSGSGGLGIDGSGIEEPIGLDVSKLDGSGIGRQKMLDDKLKKVETDRIEIEREFLVHTTSKYAAKNVERDLNNAEKAIRNLDESAGKSTHLLWPYSESCEPAEVILTLEDRRERLAKCIEVRVYYIRVIYFLPFSLLLMSIT